MLLLRSSAFCNSSTASISIEQQLRGLWPASSAQFACRLFSVPLLPRCSLSLAPRVHIGQSLSLPCASPICLARGSGTFAAWVIAGRPRALRRRRWPELRILPASLTISARPLPASEWRLAVARFCAAGLRRAANAAGLPLSRARSLSNRSSQGARESSSDVALAQAAATLPADKSKIRNFR